MSPSSAELLKEVKGRIEEIDPGVVHERLGSSHGEGSSNGSTVTAPVLVDVREGPRSTQPGHIPGAKHVPKSYLETRIEMGAARDRRRPDHPLCPSGNRSA